MVHSISLICSKAVCGFVDKSIDFVNNVMCVMFLIVNTFEKITSWFFFETMQKFPSFQCVGLAECDSALHVLCERTVICVFVSYVLSLYLLVSFQLKESPLVIQTIQIVQIQILQLSIVFDDNVLKKATTPKRTNQSLPTCLQQGTIVVTATPRYWAPPRPRRTRTSKAMCQVHLASNNPRENQWVSDTAYR